MAEEERKKPEPKPKSKAALRAERLAENRRRQKEAAKKRRKEVTDAISDKSLKVSDRTAFIQAVLSEILKKPIDQIEEKWGAKRREFREEMKGKDISLGKYIQKLTKATLPFEEKMEQAALIAVAYIEEITEGGKITPEVIMRMKKSVNAKASLLTKLLLRKKNENLLAALKWALGEASAEGRSVSEGKPKALATLISCLDEDPNYKKEKTTFVWMILTFMNSRDRVAFAKDYIKAKIEAEKTKFLEAGNKNGVFSPEEMKEILGRELNTEEKKAYALGWKRQNDFVEAARYIAMSPYGGKNIMGEMFTFKNILVHFLAPLWAGLTLAGNTLLPFIAGGWKKPAETAKKVITNHNNWVAAGVLGAVHLSKKGKGIGDVLKGSEEEDKRKACTDLYKGTNTNPGWKEFFVGKNHSGAGVFWEYIQDSLQTDSRGNKKDELNPDQLKLDKFVKWLDSKAKNYPQKTKYAELRKKFKAEEKGYKISGHKTKDYELARFAQAFYVLKIGGAQTKSGYTKAINIARGGTPPKTV